jgi:hypothetical protein
LAGSGWQFVLNFVAGWIVLAQRPTTPWFSMTIRRLKTYTGSQGYVYQYYFVGQRPDPKLQATEYVFDVTSDRKTTYPVSVILQDSAVSGWGRVHGRSLSGSEQYAAVKMRLFRAFDEIEKLESEASGLTIDGRVLEELLQPLGIQ